MASGTTYVVSGGAQGLSVGTHVVSGAAVDVSSGADGVSDDADGLSGTAEGFGRGCGRPEDDRAKLKGRYFRCLKSSL
ncbi:MAG: hypothetical protein AUG51_01430 [Acidobacteria bacterium 13_1_20CM_3_53_8]|nr:MAG: hypothetical protein AUG51_01430 [Acidobacteria bacterium 13_1_20CM_3_53_8]